ncbi:MAG: zinc ribbon domain-containing protein [Actinobacteria bacterium]|nr:MAG: zinc ribbon domain-containing protein [Actinomycetota bacterium]
MLIFGIIVLVAVTLTIVVTPFFLKVRDDEEGANLNFTLAELEQEKETAYLGIKEADFEYKVGKLSEEDLKLLIDSYRAKAVDTMKKIEEHKAGGAKEKEAAGKMYCPSCKTEVKESARFCPGCGTSLSRSKPIKSKSLKPEMKAKKANICPSCGTKYKKDDKFCGSCGKTITTK